MTHFTCWADGYCANIHHSECIIILLLQVFLPPSFISVKILSLTKGFIRFVYFPGLRSCAEMLMQPFLLSLFVPATFPPQCRVQPRSDSVYV